MTSKMVRVIKYGYVEVPVKDGMTDRDIIEYVKEHCNENDFLWDERADWDALRVVNTESDCFDCIVTLRLIRYEDFFHPEIFEDDYVVSIPKGTVDIQGYVERLFREAAADIMLGKRSAEALRLSSADFNWGDFVEMFDDELMCKYGMSFANGTVHASSAIHETIDVNQDECLIPYDVESLPTRLIAKDNDGNIVFEDDNAGVSFDSGAVYFDDGDDANIDYTNIDFAQYQLFIVFNGRTELIPIASSFDAKSREDYYYLDI